MSKRFPAATSKTGGDETAKTAYACDKPTDGLRSMSPLERLLAIEEIRQLPLRYARGISQKDWTCVRELFTSDFYMGNGANWARGPEGFMDVMKWAGTYDRVCTVLHIHGHEIEILSPTTARGIAAAKFTFYFPPGQNYPVTGREVVAPGHQTKTVTYYYQTYERIDGRWKIKTLDHVSFDLRSDVSGHTEIFPGAYASDAGVPSHLRP